MTARLQARARAVIAAARRDLGPDVRGLTDLLLDQIPELESVRQARELLALIGEPTQQARPQGTGEKA